MTKEQFEFLKQATDSHEFHPIGKFMYKAGRYGLSKHKNDRRLTEVGHCNDFRNKDYATVVDELKKPL